LPARTEENAENISQDVRSRTPQKHLFGGLQHKFNHQLFVLQWIQNIAL
jgi:hypothetical protein